MKKNGFTLVELLAVILIIGLIFALAITNVIPIFRKSKKKGFANDAVTLAEAARIKYKDDILNNIDDDLYAGNISGKKCYSIEDHLMGEYASDLNTRLEGSVEVCFGTICDYKTKLWMTNGSMYIDGDVIDENVKVESLIKDEAVSTYYSTCGVNLPQQNIAYEFKTTGSIQSLTIPATGVYKFEVWGAQGGVYNDTLFGGYGGYSVGEITLNQHDILYIAVGGKGAAASNYTQNLSGGYNGGGYAYHWKDNNVRHTSGGGASHIALNSNRGVLSNYSSNKSEILIVAGGGGGAAYGNSKNFQGGSAGGFVGSNGTFIPNDNSTYGLGGSQIIGGSYVMGSRSWPSSNGSFGQGGSSLNSYGGASGGAGWYGGGGAAGHDGAAGGSSYIGNINLHDKAMYCYNCQEALNLPADENVFTVSTIGSSKYKNVGACPNGYSKKPVVKCAKAGDGYVRITHIP